jgi:hypothetical protein
MSTNSPLTFQEFETSLTRLGGTSPVDPAARDRFRHVALEVQTVALTRQEVGDLVKRVPEVVPVLALVVGLSQEALKNTIRHRLGTSSWLKLAAERSTEVVALLDAEFHLLSELGRQRSAQWDYVDILQERAGSRGLAGRAISRGKALEDRVEQVVGEEGLDLPYKLRTRFVGTGGRTAPCDVAIPDSGDKALIVIAIKGFDSTGSKLSDAVREVVDMADIAQPRQFVFAVIDGMGWKGRRADLHRIYDLWQNYRIEGAYTLAHFSQFRTDLESAARRLNLL